MVIVTSINVPLWLEVWKEVCRTGEGKGTAVELKMLFHQSFNEDEDADDNYLWQGMNREWKGGRGASIRTEVKRSRNPANKINITNHVINLQDNNHHIMISSTILQSIMYNILSGFWSSLTTIDNLRWWGWYLGKRPPERGSGKGSRGGGWGPTPPPGLRRIFHHCWSLLTMGAVFNTCRHHPAGWKGQDLKRLACSKSASASAWSISISISSSINEKSISGDDHWSASAWIV